MTRRSSISILLLLVLVGCTLPSSTGTPPASDAPTTAVTPLPTASATRAPDNTPSPEPTPSDTLQPRLSQTEEIIEAVPDVTLDVELHYSDHWMQVRQTVHLENSSSDAWNEVVFNVPIHSVLSAFYLDELRITLADTTQEGTPSFFGTETILHVPVPRPIQPGETVLIEMSYRVLIPPVAATDWPPNGTTGWRFELIQAGEWYPALVPYRDGEGWHTWDYRPVGDPTVYPLVNHHLRVKTEEGITVVSGGPAGQDAEGVWRFGSCRTRRSVSGKRPVFNGKQRRNGISLQLPSC
jgi:hypothetical protein